MSSAPPEIIWQIVIISLAMVAIGQIFQKKYAIPMEDQMKMQQQIQDLQERMKMAQNNPRLMQQLQFEAMEIMNKMMKKQMFPMCLRSLLFLGVLGLLRLFYGQYDKVLPFPFLFGQGWFSLYLFVSICTSIIIALIRKVIKKNHPEQQKEQIIDHVRALNQNIMFAQANPYGPSPGMGVPPYAMGAEIDENQESQNQKLNQTTTKAWKQKIIEESQENEENNDNTLSSNSNSTKVWKQKINK